MYGDLDVIYHSITLKAKEVPNTSNWKIPPALLFNIKRNKDELGNKTV